VGKKRRVLRRISVREAVGTKGKFGVKEKRRGKGKVGRRKHVGIETGPAELGGLMPE